MHLKKPQVVGRYLGAGAAQKNIVSLWLRKTLEICLMSEQNVREETAERNEFISVPCQAQRFTKITISLRLAQKSLCLCFAGVLTCSKSFN